MIAFVIMLALAALAAEGVSLRRALYGIEYDMRLSKPVAEADEALEMITCITNRSRRFVSFLRLDERVPADIHPARKPHVVSYAQRTCVLRSSVYLMPRQKLTRRTRFSMPARGRHLFNGAQLTGGDFLGLTQTDREEIRLVELVILPKPLPGFPDDAMLSGLMGDRSCQRFIHEDPMLTVGFHEYTGREPLRQIAWAQTARTGRWMAKTYDHTVERRATLLFNLDTFAFGSYGGALAEVCFSLARSACEALEARRIPYAFLSNAHPLGRPESFGEVREGLGSAHLAVVLEGLGRADALRHGTLERLIERAEAAFDASGALILMTPDARDLERDAVRRLAARSGAHLVALVPSKDACGGAEVIVCSR